MTETATVTAVPAAAPAAAPATPQPATTGTPEVPVKRGMTTKEGFDAFFAAKKAQQSSAPVPVTPVAAATPTQEAAPQASAPQAQESAPAEAPEPIQEARPEPVGEEPRGEAEQQEEQEPPLPKQLIEAIDQNADPRARRALRELAFIGLGYRNSGMRLGDVKEYLRIAPTKEVLYDISAAAQTARELMADYNDPTPEGKLRFVQRLAATNTPAFTDFVSTITEPAWLEKALPDQFTNIARTGTRNFLAWAKREAARTNDADLMTAAEILAERGNFTEGPQAAAEQKPAVDPEIAERLQELEARDRAHREQFHNDFVTSAYQAAGQDVTRRIDAIVDQALPDGTYSPAARDETRKRLGQELMRDLATNPHVRSKLDQLAYAGQYDGQHRQAFVGFVVQQAAAALPRVAASVVEHMLQISSPIRQERAERRTPQAPQRREVSSQGGRPATATAPAPIQVKGRDTKQVFDEWWNRKQAAG